MTGSSFNQIFENGTSDHINYNDTYTNNSKERTEIVKDNDENEDKKEHK